MIVPPTRPVPRPRIVTACSLASLARVEQSLLRDPALLPQRVAAASHRALCPSLRSCAFEHAGQREVHVVAAEQDVLADRDTVERAARRLLSVTAMSVKSVVPPPMSTTRIRSPTVTCSRQFGLASIQA